jgi:hypothetical protein
MFIGKKLGEDSFMCHRTPRFHFRTNLFLFLPQMTAVVTIDTIRDVKFFLLNENYVMQEIIWGVCILLRV